MLLAADSCQLPCNPCMTLGPLNPVFFTMNVQHSTLNVQRPIKIKQPNPFRSAQVDEDKNISNYDALKMENWQGTLLIDVVSKFG